MNLLLDTHVLLWWLDDNTRLSARAKTAITNGENVVFVSAVTIWETRIKEALGKLKLPRNFRSVLETQPFIMLDISAEHAHAIAKLPAHHRDPFDRMLIAQAQVERLTLITSDTRIKQYKVSVLNA
jgi:PIN domain nuclease of toxin-antitoxin system